MFIKKKKKKGEFEEFEEDPQQLVKLCHTIYERILNKYKSQIDESSMKSLLLLLKRPYVINRTLSENEKKQRIMEKINPVQLRDEYGYGYEEEEEEGEGEEESDNDNDTTTRHKCERRRTICVSGSGSGGSSSHEKKKKKTKKKKKKKNYK